MFQNTPSDALADKLHRTPNTFPLNKGKWLNDADEVLSYLQQDNTISAKPWSDITAPLKLLRQAHKIITQSERKIIAQEERIAHLEQLTTTDELTGITNRRGFMAAFDRELDRVNRDKSQGGLLIMIDLDNFKAINDTHGHEAGDVALQLVAKTLENDIRLMDVAARLGGDEFVILFGNTDREQSSERAQFLIKKLNNLSFIWKGEEVPVRASLGLKNYKRGSKAKHIFSAADANMYENKKQSKELEKVNNTMI